jgi:nitroreductase
VNEAIKAILERRSIRSFTPEPVSEEDLQLILDAGQWAPTARNIQETHLTAVVSPEKIAALNTQLKASSQVEGFDRYRDFVKGAYSINFKNAPVFIIVGSDRQNSACPVEDGTLVLANILLAAHSLGLGGCWVNQLGAVGEEPVFRALLTSIGLPSTHRVIGSAAIGHPSGPQPKPPVRKPGRINIVR